jgi:hypothetical protein
MLIGLFDPVIILPDREYTDDRLRAVLLHELSHVRRKDVLVKWLSVLACAVHWFNPIVWRTRREIDRACELACDEAVVRGLDADGRQSYGDTLLYVAADGKTPRAVLSTTMCEEKKNLKERLGAIMQSKTHTRAALVASAAVILVAVLAACALGAGSGAGTNVGIIPDNINVPDAVLAAAVDWVRSDYDGSRDIGSIAANKDKGAEFDNWRIEYIEHAYSYENMDIEVYRFEWRVHTTTPDKIQPAGGEEMYADGWFLDTYPHSWYLFFEDKDGEFVYLFALMENDCAPGDEMFTQDMLNRLAATSVPEISVPERTPLLDVDLSGGAGTQPQSVRATQLTNSWQTVDADGNGFGYFSDSVHPLQMQDYDAVTLALDNEDARIALRFGDYAPQSVRVQRWNATYAGTEDRNLLDGGEPIAADKTGFDVGDDGNDYIYEVYAMWPEGDSSYAFRIDSIGKRPAPRPDPVAEDSNYVQ